MNGKSFAILRAVMAAALAFPGASHAETVNTSADLQSNKKTTAYLFSRPMFETLFQQGVALDRKFGLQPNCKTQYSVKPYSTTILAPIEFPDNKQNPTKGIWMFRYQLERCGEAKFYNTLFIANGEAPAARPYYPGASHASPVLINDAMMSAITSAALQPGLKGCKDFEVFDMRVTQPVHDVTEGNKTIKGVWDEIWTFKACGRAVDVALRFVPDSNGGGTTFTVKQAK